MSRFLRNLVTRSLRPVQGIRPRIAPLFADYQKPIEFESEILSQPAPSASIAKPTQVRESEPAQREFEQAWIGRPEMLDEPQADTSLAETVRDATTRKVSGLELESDPQFGSDSGLHQPETEAPRGELWEPKQGDPELPLNSTPGTAKHLSQMDVSAEATQLRDEQHRSPRPGSVHLKQELPTLSRTANKTPAAVPVSVNQKVSNAAYVDDLRDVGAETPASPALHLQQFDRRTNSGPFTMETADTARTGPPKAFVTGAGRKEARRSRTPQHENAPAPTSQPDVYITIGRVEVRTTPTTARQEKKTNNAPSLELAEYLKRRDGLGGL